VATLQRRLDALEQEAEARQEAARAEWRAWLDRCIAQEDADRYWRWVVSAVERLENPTQEQRKMREHFGEFVAWRDEVGAARALYLPPLDIETRVYSWGDHLAAHLAERRRYSALLRYNILIELGRELDGEAVGRLSAWLEANAATIQDALRRCWLHGLKWEAIKDCLPSDVAQAAFEAVVSALPAPTDDDLRVVFDVPRVPNELADALADEWGL